MQGLRTTASHAGAGRTLGRTQELPAGRKRRVTACLTILRKRGALPNEHAERPGGGHVDSLQAFSDALAELERILTAMAEMSKRTDEAWKKDFIEMRRQLQIQLTALTAAAAQC